MSDQTLKCRDCRNDFVFNEGEQTWFEAKGFKPPSRCKECRRARKAAQAYLADDK